MGAFLGLMAAACFGASDFVAGYVGRRTSIGIVTLLVQVIGLATVAVALAVFPGHGPTQHALVWGGISGVGSGLGTAVLYRGLARGQMSVVAPLSAVTTAVIPGVLGMLAGERLSAYSLVGVVLALPAIALVSWSGPTRGVRSTDVAYGLAAGCGFALLFVALDHAGTRAGAWPLLPGQAVAVLVVAIPVLREMRDLGVWREAGWLSGFAGVLGGAANLLFLAATGAGQLTIVSVLAALYPAVTVVLATAVLREHLHLVQTAGLVCAGGAISLIIVS